MGRLCQFAHSHFGTSTFLRGKAVAPNQAPKTLEAIQNPNCGWFYKVNQNDFEKIPGSPIGYWASERIFKIFENSKTLEESGIVRQGASTSDNMRFLRLWPEVNFKMIGINFTKIEETNTRDKKWFPYNKGGEFKKWWGNHDYVINFGENGKELKDFQSTLNQGWTARLKSREYYFKQTLSWSKITAGSFSVRYYPDGFIFDVAGCCYFTETEFYKVLGFLNSKIVNELLKFFSPTLNYEIEQIKKLPKLDFSNINEKDVHISLEISQEYEKSKYYSWKFSSNELIRIKGYNLEETFDLYQQYWKNKFFQLHKNEQDLNRQFIEIYELQDELTPDVPLEEITILKEETSIENGDLVFHPDEVFAQFVSYAVGCMFGRYSLDKEGLILANQGETLTDFIEIVGKSQKELSFIPDEDNIIPILDDEWFEDDILARFYAFLKASFGEKEFQKNLAFVEVCLGKDIRKYFVKDFYNDHIKRYKKRPIYWLFSSPKGSFSVLIYLHRYTPDTLNKILNSYLREFIEKLNLQRKQLEHIEVNGTPSEQSKARKEIDKIDVKLADCKQYEAEILYPLASERIALDLDDGVLVNYNKLGSAVATVPGLNDKATKKKVKEFDWIDTTQIR